MTKFRSKLKKKTGTKKVAKGQSSISNPEVTKYRSKAKSRFFQSNLLITPSSNTNNGLTMEAVEKHEAMESFNNRDPVNLISGSLKDFSIADNDDIFSQSQRSVSQATTFASQFSACSNTSFSKLLTNFRPDSQIQKEMLAILAALTEILKEKGGSESSTEYFLAIMETIENAKDNSDIQAAVMLLNMGIKSVPQAVLRKKFNETAETLLELITRFVDSPDKNVLRSIISCLSVVLRAQEYSQWKLSSSMKFFDAILSFTIHTKPKIRKAAQHAVTSILLGSCFMLPPKKENEDDEEMKVEMPKIIHPVSSHVAKFCVDTFKPEVINNNQTLLLHVLGLLQTILPSFHKDDIKIISEHLLSIMTSGNMMVRTSCFQTFHSLFSSSKSDNLTTQIVGRLVTALYEYRPDRSDFRQVLAWITVMTQAHIKLTHLNRHSGIQALPRIFETSINDLWLSDKMEVVAGTSNAMKELLEECIKPLNDENDEQIPLEYHQPIKKIIKTLTKALAAPFGATSTHILVICSIAFESMGKYFEDDLEEMLTILGMRYDDQSSQRVHIEHAVLSAISSMDTEKVLSCIPLTEVNGNMSVKRSWILPLLREGLQDSSLEFFNRYIIKLAYQCYTKWQTLKEKDQKSEAHIYELLCCQLWGLFPGFCRKPKDLHEFKSIAKTLGMVLNENPDLRPPILDGFKELLTNLESDDEKEIFAKYAQNYMTRFFNIYTTKPTTSYENEIRLSAFEVAQLYLKVTPKTVMNSLFESAVTQMNSKSPGSFMYDMLFDIVEAMTLFQSSDKIEELFKSYIVATLIKEKKDKTKAVEVVEGSEKLKDLSVRRRMKKAYKLLHDIMKSENEGCLEFVDGHLNEIERILTKSTYKVAEATQVMRLSCLNGILEKKAFVDVKEKIVKISITEVLSSFNNEAVMKDGIAFNLLRAIGKVYEDGERLKDFVDSIMTGLVGDHQLTSNTIVALKFIIQEFAENLTVDTHKFILEQVLEFVVSNQRNEVNASLQFLVMFVKILPAPFVASNLRLIIKAISLMVHDTRRHCRLILSFLMKKLCKKFTPEEIIKLVPGSDEALHKKLRNIKKEINRAKRNRVENSKKKSKGGEGEDDSDDEFMNLEKKSMTIDDILADSSDEGSVESDEDNAKTKVKNPETFIREDADTIVDLADSNAFSKLTTTKPIVNQSHLKSKNKDENRGFKTAPDGRLIIEDIEDKESDSDDDDMTEYKDKSKTKVYDQESDEEKDEPSKKKIGLNAYKAGGSGIHRPLAASVKSGYSNISKISKKSSASSRLPGSEYKAKKAGGDVKRKGKHEPYAYVALSRNALNRRKRSKMGNQFKNIAKKSKENKKSSKK
ncbi:CLUMA_CG017972, isoform A [Clunio marinus]|uniref:CLUMA_CG017972, isoform A n=1 Tax=Clunio marinus TaxID=568069 RepID=A0A1J1J2P6_9DIPT|nr:CLUMA_CG017972, isoform A [Clunio marinus]